MEANINNINSNNLSKYSTNLNLVNFIKEKNEDNNTNQINSESKKMNEFLLELAKILENKLKTNIRLHQKGFDIYKAKIFSEKNLILNSISSDIKSLTINQLIELLTEMKMKKKNEKNTEYFTIGKKMNNNKINIDQNSIDKMNKIFIEDYSYNNNINDNSNDDSHEKKNNKFNNKFQFKYNKNVNGLNAINNNMNGNCVKSSCNVLHGHGHRCYFDPKNVYHSTSPVFIKNKKYESKTIEDNKSINNYNNFYEEQKINDNL